MERRLAAILAADVVGYSRLMERDEAGTLAALKSRRTEILQPMVSKHRGRIVKLMGDGVLVEFNSAVNAVACAVELQAAMNSANADEAEAQRIVLRIGINLGDVMVEGSDLYGDGVNIAARLEGLSEAGGVCISGSVFEHINGKLPHSFVSLGPQTLKNIDRAIHVYRLAGNDRSSPKASAVGLPLPDKPSIAVLPFTNMSDDSRQEYLSDGLTEDIITELSRYRELFVVARNSSFQFRGKSIDMRQVGKELGVEYLVEGSVRRAGDRLRVTAQLIEARTGNHIWANRYDRGTEEVFAIQDDVTQAIASTLVEQLRHSRVDRARQKPTSAWAAYELMLQARYHTDRYETEAAHALLERAIQIDPNYADPYATLAYVYLHKFFDDNQPQTINQMLVYAEKALSLDDRNEICHLVVGQALIYLRKFDLAGVHLDRAIALNPNNYFVGAARANWLCRVGRMEEALRSVEELMRHDPLPPPWFWELRSQILFQLDRYAEVIESTSQKSPLQYWDHAYMAAAYACLGKNAEARAQATEVLRMKNDFSIAAYAIQDPYKDPARQKRVLDALRTAGLPD